MDTAPAPDPPRNLVLFCDGTGNIWGNQRDTHVVTLARACVQDTGQIVYYDPGVGTASDAPGVGFWASLKAHTRHLWGLAFGGGIYDNIGGAYGFLVRHWRQGDRIFLFGFSRGAFTVRAVAGMVNLFGIVRPQAENMVPVMLRVYFGRVDAHNRRQQTRQQVADDLRAHFADDDGARARVHFVGVFDTVASVGGLLSQAITSDHRVAGKCFVHVRHAVAADERRLRYAPRLYRAEPVPFTQLDEPSFEQRWFAGAHSDMAGTYPERGLAEPVRRWMTGAAAQAGLRLKPDPGARDRPDPQAPSHDEALASWLGGLWALTGLQHRTLPAPVDAAQAAATGDRLRAVTRAAVWRACLLVGVVTVLLFALGQSTPLLRGDAVQGLCGWSGACQLQALQLHAAGLPLSVWQGYAEQRHAAGLRGALWADGLLIVAYTLLACHLTALAHGRWRHWRRDDEAAHRRLQRVMRWPLVVAPLADVLENACTALLMRPDPAAGWAWLLSASSALKLFALVVLVLLWAASLRQRPPAPSTIAA